MQLVVATPLYLTADTSRTLYSASFRFRWPVCVLHRLQGLLSLGYGLVSTGGTGRTLVKAGLEVQQVEDLTKFPEMMDGKARTTTTTATANPTNSTTTASTTNTYMTSTTTTNITTNTTTSTTANRCFRCYRCRARFGFRLCFLC